MSPERVSGNFCPRQKKALDKKPTSSQRKNHMRQEQVTALHRRLNNFDHDFVVEAAVSLDSELE
jgi:hypothetical protein